MLNTVSAKLSISQCKHTCVCNNDWSLFITENKTIQSLYFLYDKQENVKV